MRRVDLISVLGSGEAGFQHASFDPGSQGRRCFHTQWRGPGVAKCGKCDARITARRVRAGSAPRSSGRWASLRVPVDGARQVAIRSTGAGSRCARDGVTVATGTVTGEWTSPRRWLPVLRGLPDATGGASSKPIPAWGRVAAWLGRSSKGRLTMRNRGTTVAVGCGDSVRVISFGESSCKSLGPLSPYEVAWRRTPRLRWSREGRVRSTRSWVWRNRPE